MEKRKKSIEYALSAFGFDCLPINFLEIVEEATNSENVTVHQKCFVKYGETYFSKSTTLFSTIPKNISLEECGLVPTKYVKPAILRKRTNLTNKLPYQLKEVALPRIVYLKSAKKRKLEIEDEASKKRKIDFLENTKSFVEDHKTEFAKHKLQEEVKER